jgi:hypothetical protein
MKHGTENLRTKGHSPASGLFFVLATVSFLIGAGNGFDFSKHSIPIEEIQSGGPPKDGIPALTNPRFVPRERAAFLRDTDRVLGIVQGTEARAYPIRILNWHEVVNDKINGKPVLISYCPLCGTGMAFDPVIGGKTYTFGVSGLLYNSDVLMYDHPTESLWSQIKQEAVTGDLTGKRLRLIPLTHTTWGKWKREHPGTVVLSPDTGYERDYGRDPYAGYASSPRVMFSVQPSSDRYSPKEWVIGIVINEEAKAYAFSELSRQPAVFTDKVGGARIHVHYDEESKTASVTDEGGTLLPSVTAYWFAWHAFYPESAIFSGR